MTCTKRIGIPDTGCCNPKKREPGFYWIKFDADSQSIALWSGKYWHVIDEPQSKLTDENLYEIDEQRIESRCCFNPKEQRPPGLYWVKHISGSWTIAQWLRDYFVVLGCQQRYYDNCFDEIDERRIERQSEVKREVTKNQIKDVLRNVRDMLGRQLPVDTSYEQLDEIVATKIMELKGTALKEECGCRPASLISEIEGITNEVVEACCMPKILEVKEKIRSAAMRGDHTIYIEISQENYTVSSYFKRLGFESDQVGLYIYIRW